MDKFKFIKVGSRALALSNIIEYSMYEYSKKQVWYVEVRYSLTSRSVTLCEMDNEKDAKEFLNKFENWIQSSNAFFDSYKIGDEIVAKIK